MSRRTFLGMMAAATAAGCRTGRDQVAVPLARRHPETAPGVAAHYASTCPLGQRTCAVLVKTREGRPIHVEGNDAHPALAGKACLQAIAGIQSLYGPDRPASPRLGGHPAPWAQALGDLLETLRAARHRGRPILLLTGATRSPSREALLKALRQTLPTLEHLAWEPGLALGAQAGTLAAFGVAALPRPRLEAARCVLSLGADFLGGEDPAASRAFALGRRDPAAMNRLWVLEGPMTLTGSNADHRLPVKPSRLAPLAFALARDLHARHGVPLPAGARLPALPSHEDLPAAFRDGLVEDLRRAGPGAAVLCGEGLPREAQIASHLLNAMLGSRALDLEPVPRLQGLEDLARAVEGMACGRYAAALIWGVNPAYAYPDRQAWRAALERVPRTAWLGAEEDETSGQCRLVLPEHHWLEAWGDHVDNRFLTLQQPAVEPLYDTRQGEDVLLELLRGLGRKGPEDARALLQDRWRREVHPPYRPVPFDRFFQAALHEGVLELPPHPAPAFRGACVEAAARAVFPTGPFELVLRPGHAVRDGRYAGSGWLQELPDPVTKTTWGHPLRLAPEDAAAAGLRDGDLAWVRVGRAQALFSVLAQKGQARGTLDAALGYGRLAGAGRGVGTNAYALTQAPYPHLLAGAALAKARGRMELPSTQGRPALEGEIPARVLPLGQLAGHVRKDPDLPTLYPTPYPGLPPAEHRWGMAIDLSACLGCGACAVACQSENNVAVVGPRQVAQGREMHWLRIDTYWTASGAVHQPMLCQHCEHAPCETVCPVNATNHSPEGLNQMVYNRCVGVRYCANNCPYKVRRFNYLEYNGAKAEPELLAFNPDVTVRPRGVMEKCTFCVQRIQEGRQRKGRDLKDGDIVPACQASCPGDAIIFGDLNDPRSRASRLSAAPRGYKVLEELGARPVVTYLAKVSNPMPGAEP